MNTLYSLLILLGAFIFGGILTIPMIILMGIGGGLGAMLFHLGSKNQIDILQGVGLLLTALGQALIVSLYAIFLVSVIRAWQISFPNSVMWPIWIAGFYLANAPPGLAMKDPDALKTAQGHTLGFAGLLVSCTFFVTVFRPSWIENWVSWIPFFEYCLL